MLRLKDLGGSVRQMEVALDSAQRPDALARAAVDLVDGIERLVADQVGVIFFVILEDIGMGPAGALSLLRGTIVLDITPGGVDDLKVTVGAQFDDLVAGECLEAFGATVVFQK